MEFLEFEMFPHEHLVIPKDKLHTIIANNSQHIWYLARLKIGFGCDFSSVKLTFAKINISIIGLHLCRKKEKLRTYSK